MQLTQIGIIVNNECYSNESLLFYEHLSQKKLNVLILKPNIEYHNAAGVEVVLNYAKLQSLTALILLVPRQEMLRILDIAKHNGLSLPKYIWLTVFDIPEVLRRNKYPEMQLVNIPSQFSNFKALLHFNSSNW